MSKNRNRIIGLLGSITVVALIFFVIEFIELESHNYNVMNEKGEKLNAIVIETKYLIRLRFLDIDPSYFITIVKSIEYIGVNGILPKKIFRNTYFFNNRAKEIGYSDGINYTVFGLDSIRFNTFKHYNMNLKVLGDEIVIVRNKE